MNYIVFTQDIPGEREWLKEQFADCTFLETRDSGKWPKSYPVDLGQDCVWEVPPDMNDDTTHWPGQTVKSLFDINFKTITNRWTDSDRLLFGSYKFDRTYKSDKALVLHLPRSGTVFLQTVLTNCGYDRITDWLPANPTVINHSVPQLPDNSESDLEIGKIEYNFIIQQQPNIFFVYRKDWWEWIVSNIIGQKVGYFHYDTMPNLSNIPLLHITKKDIENLVDAVKYSFNNLCYMACTFRELNFYIFEYSDLIKNQSLTDHKKINYDKKSFFKNYDEMKEMFDHNYKNILNLWSERCLTHLADMQCKFPKNFNNLLQLKNHV